MNTMSKMRGTTAIRRAFDGRRRLRGWRNNHFGGMEAVKAHPLSMCRFRPDEGGTVSTKLDIKLAPVSGYMRTHAYVDVVQVFVPYQAIEKLHWPGNKDGGVTEMTRRRLMAGEGLGMGTTTEISKACNIHSKSVGGDDRVSASIRVAYNAAVNHLRKAAYFDADEVAGGNDHILPAVLTANILDRFDGVLDPERNIDGSINLTGNLPVKGIGLRGDVAPTKSTPTAAVRETGENGTVTYPEGVNYAGGGNNALMVKMKEGTLEPEITIDLAGTSEITLRDMIESQKLDGLIREFAQMIQDDPINGEEVVERALYGLSVDYDHNCQVVYRQVHELTPAHQRPTDGASINDVSAHFELNTRFSTIVPRSQLGGQLVTLAMIKPVETLAKQPDPAQTENWALVNRVHDETELDEVLLTRADLESGVADNDEDTPVFWVGHNSLKHNYATRGPNEQQTYQVELKSTMWTYEIPTSVTPDNINYPAQGIDMYPFHNWNGAAAEYTIDQVAAISTSLAKGPNPIERIRLFADDPALLGDE